MPSKLDSYIPEIEECVNAGDSVNSMAARFEVARSTMQDFMKKHFASVILETSSDAADSLIQDPGVAKEIPVVHRHYEHLDSLHTYPIGDIHLGSPSCAEDVLDQWLEYLVGQDSVSLLNTGDNFNVAIAGSKSDIYAEKAPLNEVRPLLIEKLLPLKDKIDAIIDGNHEARYYRATGDSPNQMVAEALGVAYAPAAILVVYHVGDQEYSCYLRHGNGGGASMGAAVNRLEKQERIIDADIYVSGHTHTQVAFPKNIFVRDGDAILRKKRLFVCSGSFLSYEDYAKVAGYAPAHIGAPRIFMDGKKHDLHASV